VQPRGPFPKRRFPIRLLEFLFPATDGICGLGLRLESRTWRAGCGSRPSQRLSGYVEQGLSGGAATLAFPVWLFLSGT